MFFFIQSITIVVAMFTISSLDMTEENTQTIENSSFKSSVSLTTPLRKKPNFHCDNQAFYFSKTKATVYKISDAPSFGLVYSIYHRYKPNQPGDTAVVEVVVVVPTPTATPTPATTPPGPPGVVPTPPVDAAAWAAASFCLAAAAARSLACSPGGRLYFSSSLARLVRGVLAVLV